MKTYKNLFNRICSRENLYKAYLKARKGKRYNREVMEFTANLEQNLQILQDSLLSQTYVHGKYREFIVNDSKKRLIKAAPFKDRVVHHAVYAALEPIFDKSFIDYSYACRKGKGTHLAVKNLRGMLKSPKAKYALQCDISKYFDSIDHTILMQMLSQKIADQKTLDLLKLILDSTCSKVRDDGQKTGIPIGNLTSQLFANVYLNKLDQFVKHALRQKFYIRYMDDFLILGPAKEALHTIKERIRDFVRDVLRLALHPKKAVVYPVCVGVDFLGYVLKGKVSLLRKSTVKRFLARMAEYKHLIKEGLMSRQKYGLGVKCFMNYAGYGDSWNLRVALCRVLVITGFVLGAGVLSLAYSQKAYAGYETAKFNQGYNTGGEYYLDAGNIGAGVQTVSFWLSGTTGGNIVDFNGTQYVAISGAGAITLTGITGTVYVDGVASSTVPDSNWHFVVVTTDTDINASAVKFGSLEMGNFDGTLDDVKFYSYALSAREVAEKYRQGSPTMALGGTINGDLHLVGDAYFTEDLHLTGAFYDTSDSAGTDGQYLKSTANGTAWTSFSAGVDILPTGTEGQMLYNNAGVWTAYSGMYWDDTNSRLGVGTTAPSEKLEIAGNIKLSGASPKMSSTTGLDLDLGDSAGSYSFDIRDSSDTNLLTLDSLGSLTLNGQTASSAVFNLTPTGTTDLFTINRSGTGTGFAFRVNDGGAGDTSPFIITSAGYVGIGTTSPSYQLEITGTLGVGSTAYFASTVGIGTTAPGYSLEVSGGDIYTSGDLRVAGDDIFMSTNTANYFLMADGTNYNPTSPADARTGLGLVSGGTGDIWVEKAGDTMTGNLTLNKADGSIVFDTLTATDTDFWLGVQDDAGSDDDDLFMIGDGTTPGTNPFLTINSSGYVGVGTTGPVALLEVMGATNQLQLSYDASNYNIWSVASDGTLSHNNNGTTIATYNTAGISFKTPTSFDTAGDVSMAYNLVMSNPVSSGITFEGAGTISTSHPSANYNLTLSAANAGTVIVDDTLSLSGIVRPLVDSTSALRLQSSAGVDVLTLDTTNGRVGIGTTAPATGAKLHVEGQCVTGDTLLKRRRRRKNKKGDDDTGEGEEWEDVRIDQIQPGDEILTLNEKTGRFVVSTVNALMDMGIKPIYTLTTASGKTIRTTGNHPYFVRLREEIATRAMKMLENKKEAGVSQAYATKKAGIDKVYSTSEGTISESLDDVNTGEWVKVTNINLGGEVATVEGWEQIVSIKQTKAEQVYDIEVAGTHNFVANGIVAHNTYIKGADQLNTSFALRTVDSTGADIFDITNAGNIGIGTTNPTSLLHSVASGAKTADYIGNSLEINATSATATIIKTGLSISSTGTWNGSGAVNRGLYVNATGGTTNYSAIFEGGYVGIGTTAPTVALEVTGEARITGLASADYYVCVDAEGDLFESATACSGSDIRLKENITPLASALEGVLALNPVTFNWKDTQKSGAQLEVGFIAQEMEQYFPQVVRTNPDGYLGIKYDVFSAILTKAVQEQELKLAGLGDQMLGVDDFMTQTNQTLQSLASSQEESSRQIAQIQSLLAVLGIQDPQSSESSQSSASAGFAGILDTNLLTSMQTVYDNFVQLVEALGLKQVDGELVVESAMTVLGDAGFANVDISGDLRVGLLEVNSLENSINIVGPSCVSGEDANINDELCQSQTIYLQKNLAGNIDLFNGAIIFSPNGNITAEEIDAKKLVAQVYGVNSVGQSVGEGIIPAGETNIAITSSTAQSNYKVFVTATSNTEGVELFVKEKSQGEFVVALSGTSAADIKFDWWVVQVD